MRADSAGPDGPTGPVSRKFHAAASIQSTVRATGPEAAPGDDGGSPPILRRRQRGSTISMRGPHSARWIGGMIGSAMDLRPGATVAGRVLIGTQGWNYAA